MAIEFDRKKLAENLAKNAALAKDVIIKRAEDFGAVAKENASKIADDAMQLKEKKQQDYLEWRYNPVSPDYDRNSLPKLVVLDDEGERANIDICKGAVGWLDKHHGLQTLHLYHQYSDAFGLTFYPKPARGSIYYLDAFSDGRYIEVGSYFDTIQEERVGELFEIAHALGAKYCRIELYEEKKQARLFSAGDKGSAVAPVAVEGVPVDELVVSNEWKADAAWEEEYKNINVFQTTFSGGEAYEPELHWFAGSSVIKALIKSRVNPQGGSLSSKFRQKIERVGRSSLSASAASEVEAAMKSLGVKDNFSLTGEAKKSERQVFVYELKF